MSGMENGGKKPSTNRSRDKGDANTAAKAMRIACAVVAALSALSAVVCAVCYAVYRTDVLFIPIALCAAVALISFTYFGSTKG